MINGTAFMSGIAGLLVEESKRIVDIATRFAAASLEVLEGFDDSLHPVLHGVRPHSGQIEIAKRMKQLLRGSSRLHDRTQFAKKILLKADVYQIPESVQEVYSIRCTPQILGPIFDTLSHASQVTRIEINSVTDNPIVDVAHKRFLHGGNFHGDYIATAMDQLKAGIVKLTMLSERRVNFFLNANVNKTYTPFLNIHKPGLSLALQALQFTATSTTAMSQSLAMPHTIHSISTNADNQDVVSMGTDAALLAQKTIENDYVVLEIEAITISQAIDITKAQRTLSPETLRMYKTVRHVFPVIKNDRVVIEQLSHVMRVLQTDNLFLAQWL